MSGLKVEKKGRISEHSQSKRTPTVQWSTVNTHPMSLSYEESFTLHSQDTHAFWASTACQDSKSKRKEKIGTLTNQKDTKSAMVSSQHSTHDSQILKFSNHSLHIEVLSTEAHHQQTRVNRNTAEQIQNDLLNTEGPSTLICKQSTRSLSKLAPPCMFNWNSHESGRETSRPEVDVLKKLLSKLAYWE
jgi:hypothetical protein